LQTFSSASKSPVIFEADDRKAALDGKYTVLLMAL
jgi:hypothetical protein